MTSFTYRELYAPAHFGNSYEVMAPYEMRAVLNEAKFWGFNAYGDWLDAADIKSPFNSPKNTYLLPQAIWEQKLSSFRIANELGLQTDLVITPNHVYLDQLMPELLAETKGDERFFGQLLCPSKQKAREIILNNQRQIFRELKANGVTLNAITGCPFDYGGCSCSSCAPWILTFGRLMVDIVNIAREFFPNIHPRLIGWWWTEEEHQLFSQWADQEHPGLFKSLAAHILYGKTSPNPQINLPQNCDFHAFVHIGYGNTDTHRDCYGTWGPVVAPDRMAKTISSLTALGCNGYAAYSEGICDDVNKALLAGMTSGQFSQPQEVLAAYAERYFYLNGQLCNDWADWFLQWGEPLTVDISKARRDFDRLSANVTSSWRLAQWDARLRLYAAHWEVLHHNEWDNEKRSAAEQFYNELRYLYRDIWGLGLVRHVLSPRFFTPEWYNGWQDASRQAVEVGSEY